MVRRDKIVAKHTAGRDAVIREIGRGEVKRREFGGMLSDMPVGFEHPRPSGPKVAHVESNAVFFKKRWKAKQQKSGPEGPLSTFGGSVRLFTLHCAYAAIQGNRQLREHRPEAEALQGSAQRSL